MTTMNEIPSHAADAITTVARVRVYDGAAESVQKIGFNCVAATALDVDAIAEYVAAADREVSLVELRSTVDKPFVSKEFSVRPPLDEPVLTDLGRKLVEGAFYINGAHPEGIMLIDNTGKDLPDHPMDRGRDVINQSPTLPFAGGRMAVS